MILEGIVTTMDATGGLNVAPMGPRIEPNFERFVLRPFKTSTTYRNLKEHGEGVFHVTDDVLLLARATIGNVPEAPTRSAGRVRGRILLESCRYFEFQVTEIDDREERATVQLETVEQGVFRPFFGFNRAKHAVIEMAILASRIGFLPFEEVEPELKKFSVIIDKTGGSQELEAFALLENHIKTIARLRGVEPGTQRS